MGDLFKIANSFFMMPFKKIIFLVLLFTFLMPSFVLADTSSKIPALNPLCWREESCLKMRESYGVTSKVEQAKGCIKEDPCKEKGWCKCLPAGSTDTQIGIGGVNSFIHLGDYLLVVFNYALMMAGVLSVLVLLVSGVQWMISGGNSDVIKRAKKRMAGAFVGLFLAYGSFFILSQINPNLISLRLPQIFMLKPQELMPTFCSEFSDDTTKLALVAGIDNQIAPITTAPSSSKYIYSFELAKADTTPLTDSTNKMNWFTCGTRFLAKDGGLHPCFGDFCRQDSSGGATYAMACNPNGKGNTKYICEKGNMTGRIYSSDLIEKVTGGCLVKTAMSKEGWVEMEDSVGPVKQIMDIVAVCNDVKKGKKYPMMYTPPKGASPGTITRTTEGSNVSYYYNSSISNQSIDAMEASCYNHAGGTKGFALKVDMNEACDPTGEYHYIGKNGVDLGDDKFFSSPFALGVGKGYFFTTAEIKKGIRLNIDVSKVYDIDGTADHTRIEEWKKAGYSNR